MTTTSFDLSVDEEGDGTLVIYTADGNSRVFDSDHPNFKQLIQTVVVEQGDPTPFLSVAAAVQQLDDRVEVKNDTIYFDGEPVHTTLGATILRYVREGRESTGLVKFMENLAENPSFRSREQLFSWVKDRDLIIDEDGYFLGYKGVRPDGKSSHNGGAEVNGVWVDGNVPNEEGSVISMPRAKVQDDPNIGCSFGLHVGTYNYAKSFASRLLEVRVNPRDVVSVPVECNEQKLRCCRYEVLKLHELPVDDLSHWEADRTIDELDDEEFEDVLEPYVPRGFITRLLEKRRNRKTVEVDS